MTEQVLKPRHRTNQRLRALPYISPSLWNNLGKSLKTSVSLNAFKHNIKDYFKSNVHKYIMLITIEIRLYMSFCVIPAINLYFIIVNFNLLGRL